MGINRRVVGQCGRLQSVGVIKPRGEFVLYLAPRVAGVHVPIAFRSIRKSSRQNRYIVADVIRDGKWQGAPEK